MRRGRQAAGETREVLLRAATEVFVETGFSGARVDEIARRARANKAMIYYHFRNKRGLYDAVLADLLGPLQALVESATTQADPVARLRYFYRGLVQRLIERPALAHAMAREVIAGGRHMGKAAAQALLRVLTFVRETLAEGSKRGAVRAADPLLVHLTVMGSILLYFVGVPFRERILPMMRPAEMEPSVEDLQHHLDGLLERMLEPSRSPGS
jgi:AcrR family transcriptional regulator